MATTVQDAAVISSQALSIEGLMRWTSAISLKTKLDEALRDCVAQLRRQTDASPDLALLFLSPHFHRDYHEAPKLLDRFMKPKRLFGCSADGIIGAGKEAEQQPAVAVMGGYLPNVSLTPFHLESDRLPDMDASPRAWAEAVGFEDRTQQPHFLVIADPFSFNPEDLARGLDYAFPNSVKVGGLASGARRPGQNILYLDHASYHSGAVGLALSGDIAIDPIVAQGCRPIGKRFRVTQCEDNRLIELDGKPALQAVEDMIEELPEADQEMVRHSLFLGMLTNPLKRGASRGDFLIRNIVGLDPDGGWLAIGAPLRHGQTVQFHLRDKKTSAEDLNRMLQRYAASSPATPPKGALLFSCLGRGRHLYGISNHDTDIFLKSIGRLPIAGFFCNGEIGPVEGNTYLHGYTSCFGILRPASRKSS